MVALNKLRVKTTEYNKSVTCRYITILVIISCPHDLTWVLPHIKTVVALGSYYLAFWGRLGTFPSPLLSDGALWRISELLSQLIFSMRSGMFFFDCNSEYVVLTRS